jgi:prevent-host-death family protein
MEQIGIFDAKTHFSELVDRVVREGRPITITRRGVPLVDIVPTNAAGEVQMTREEAIAELMDLRKTLPRMTHEEIREAIEEGRQ